MRKTAASQGGCEPDVSRQRVNITFEQSGEAVSADFWGWIYIPGGTELTSVTLIGILPLLGDILTRTQPGRMRNRWYYETI